MLKKNKNYILHICMCIHMYVLKKKKVFFIDKQVHNWQLVRKHIR